MSIIGKRFHSYNEIGQVRWQGEILEQIDDSHFRVVLFSWLTGRENGHEIVSTLDMGNWTYYNTDEEMRNAVEWRDWQVYRIDGWPLERFS